MNRGQKKTRNLDRVLCYGGIGFLVFVVFLFVFFLLPSAQVEQEQEKFFILDNGELTEAEVIQFYVGSDGNFTGIADRQLSIPVEIKQGDRIVILVKKGS